jgi:hypothetical protein
VRWDRNMKLRTRPMKEANIASSLMVNIKSSSLKCCDDLPWFEDGSFAMSAYGIVTATSSVVTPVWRALSR